MTLEDFKTAIYLIYSVAFFFAVLVALKTDIKNVNTPNYLNYFLVCIVSLVLFLLFANRSILVGTDTGLMMLIYNNYDRILDNREPLYRYLFILLHYFTDAQGYLAFIAILYFGNILLFIRNRENTVNQYLFFFFFICMSFFLPLGINIARQGVSLMFFLNAVDYFWRKRWKTMTALLLGSLFFHTTAAIAIAVFILALFSSKRKRLILPVSFFVICTILSVLNINVFQALAGGVGIDALDVRATGYLQKETYGYEVGFRPTFFLYNLVFGLIGFFSVRYAQRYGMAEMAERLRLYLCYFLYASGLFFLAFAIPFSDRWGLFSWIFIPFFFEPFFKVGGRHFAVLSVFFSAGLFLLFQFVLSK